MTTADPPAPQPPPADEGYNLAARVYGNGSRSRSRDGAAANGDADAGNGDAPQYNLAARVYGNGDGGDEEGSNGHAVVAADEPYNLAARVYGKGPQAAPDTDASAQSAVAVAAPAPAEAVAPPRGGGPPAPALAGVGPSGGGITSLRTFDSLHVPAFRWYFLAMLGQNAGMNMQMLVRSFLVFELTGSFAALGVMALASAVPMLLLSPVGGVMADRLPKRYVLQVGQTVSMLTALVVAMLLVFDVLRFEHLFVASVVQGMTMALMMPSRQSMVPEIVGDDRLMNAIALQSSGMSSMRLIAPAVGGALLATVGWQWVYFLMASLYFTAIVTLSRVPARRVPVDPAATNAMMQMQGGRFRGRGAAGLADMLAGMRYVAHHPVIFMVMAVNLFVVMLSMPYQHLLAGFVKDVLHEGPDKLGLIMSITGVGSLAGSLVIASMPNKNRGKIWLAGMLIMGFALLAFSLSRVFWVSALISIAIGVGQTSRMALSNIIVQSYVDDAYRGRVMSIYMMEFGLTAFGTFAIAILANAIGVEWAFGGTAMGLVLLSLGLYAFLPRLRKLN